MGTRVRPRNLRGTQPVLNSPEVIATRLVNGKVTLIHRRLWPALVRVADRFPKERLAAVDEEHTASGAHRTIEIPFPEWVPAQEITAARLLTVDDALHNCQPASADRRLDKPAMAALVGVIADRCWDQIIGGLRAPAGDESPALGIPPQTSQPGRVGRPGMLTNAILQTSERSECGCFQAQPAQTSGRS